MQKHVTVAAALALSLLLAVGSTAAQQMQSHRIASMEIDSAEIVNYSPEHRSICIAAVSTIEIISIADPANPDYAGRITIDIEPWGGAVNSVAVHGDLIAAAIENDDKQQPGTIVFFDFAGNHLATFPAGALPDMVTFTPDGTCVLAANEGEPSDDYTDDPEGSITLIDISGGLATANAVQIGFSAFNSDKDALIASGVRIYGPGATVARDLEPEYIAVSDDSRTAWVTLQENNAMAEIDIAGRYVTAIYPLGYKDHSHRGNEIDASDKDDAINLQGWPVLGMYQPDAVAPFTCNGRTYLITANEGDARDYDTFSEEARVDDLDLDPAAFPNADDLQKKSALGRLKTTTTLGDTDGDGDNDLIYSYGARSFSIWTPYRGEMKQVYDSGSEIARITAALQPRSFNCNDGLTKEFDARSDDKGIEPEGVTTGMIDGTPYAFVGMERGLGGIMVYDISDPRCPAFVTWVLSNDGSGDAGNDIAPEGLAFIAPEQNPDGRALLVATFEESGSTAIYALTFSSQAQPVVSPQTGTIGTRLQITGAGFGTSAGTVTAGGKKTRTDLWSDTLIQCTVVHQMEPGPVEITVTPRKGDAVVLSDTFTVTAPQITAVEPAGGAAAGETVTVRGAYFGSDKARVKVYLYSAGSTTLLKEVETGMDAATGESICTFTMPALQAGPVTLRIRNLIDWSEPVVLGSACPIAYPETAALPFAMLDTLETGVQVRNGGFGSAMTAHPSECSLFYALTDRGPNVDYSGELGSGKMFPVPDYTPRIGCFRIGEDGTVALEREILLRDNHGVPVTGLPNPAGMGATGEIAYDPSGNVLGTDPFGIDSEGLVAVSDGTFWVCDEYGPHIVHYTEAGTEIERINPFGSGTRGRRLPAVFATRRANRGMEGLAITPDEKTLVGIMQSTMYNPGKADIVNKTLTRIVTFDIRSGSTKQYLYRQEANNLSNSEIVAVSDTAFLVVERDGGFEGTNAVYKRLYLIDLSGATDVSGDFNDERGLTIDDRTLEQMTWDELAAHSIVPVSKTLVADLLTDLPGGYPHDKLEGLWLIDDSTIAVLNDDDFAIGVANDQIIQKILPATGDVDGNVLRVLTLDTPL